MTIFERIILLNMKKIFILAVSAAVLCACGSSRSVTNVYRADDSDAQGEINVGYGSVNREKLTYSVTQVEVDEKEAIVYNNIWDYLRGRVPGVMIGNAGPGETPTINVRGINSINSSTQPLFVVDGVETPDISYMNPNDIATVSVLKDASASIYGTRGGNGVILITTKGAKEAARIEAEAKREARQAAKAERQSRRGK
jgi:TonB-dependent SusC/RagA subfamily outer membrane receptor